MATVQESRTSRIPDRHLLVTSRLRSRRHALGLTQKQVVTRLATLGVSSTNKSLSSLEHGTGVDLAKLPELAAALECTVTYLLGLTDDPASWQPDTALSWRPQPERPAALPDNGPGTGPGGYGQGDGQGRDYDEPVSGRQGWILGPYVPEGRRRGDATADPY
jgi:transcriptional regulator with XRE-family HTH domain